MKKSASEELLETIKRKVLHKQEIVLKTFQLLVINERLDEINRIAELCHEVIDADILENLDAEWDLLELALRSSISHRKQSQDTCRTKAENRFGITFPKENHL